MEQVTSVYLKEGLLEDIAELSDITQLNDPEFVAALRQANATELQLYFNKFIKTLSNNAQTIVKDAFGLTNKIQGELPQNLDTQSRYALMQAKIKNEYLDEAEKIGEGVVQINEYILKLQARLAYIARNRQSSVNAAITTNLKKRLNDLFALLRGPTELIVRAM